MVKRFNIKLRKVKCNRIALLSIYRNEIKWRTNSNTGKTSSMKRSGVTLVLVFGWRCYQLLKWSVPAFMQYVSLAHLSLISTSYSQGSPRIFVCFISPNYLRLLIVSIAARIKINWARYWIWVIDLGRFCIVQQNMVSVLLNWNHLKRWSRMCQA